MTDYERLAYRQVLRDDVPFEGGARDDSRISINSHAALAMRTEVNLPSFLLAYLHVEFLLAHLNPYLTLLVLALWTVAVTTAVVADVYLTAPRTHFDMAAERSCTAYGHCAERLTDLVNYGVFGIELTAPIPDYLTDIKPWACHY